MKSFKTKIDIIGINPFVPVPDAVLKVLFEQAGKDKGPIPIKGEIDGHSFVQTLVKFRGVWRLYINTPMLKAAKKEVGEIITLSIQFDSDERVIPVHPKLKKALTKNKEAKKIFDSLRPSLQKEIVRYISFLKTDESVERNVNKAINFLLGKERFIGRDKPN